MSSTNYDSRPLFFQFSWKELFSLWLVTLLIFAFLILYAFEFPRFGNIFQVKGLLLFSLFAFSIIGALLGLFVSFKEKDLNERMKVFFFIFFTALFFAPLFGSLTNRIFPLHTEVKSYEIFEVELILSLIHI